MGWSAGSGLAAARTPSGGGPESDGVGCAGAAEPAGRTAAPGRTKGEASAGGGPSSPEPGGSSSHRWNGGGRASRSRGKGRLYAPISSTHLSFAALVSWDASCHWAGSRIPLLKKPGQ